MLLNGLREYSQRRARDSGFATTDQLLNPAWSLSNPAIPFSVTHTDCSNRRLSILETRIISHGIRVNIVSPGYVETEQSGVHPPAVRKFHEDSVPLRRVSPFVTLRRALQANRTPPALCINVVLSTQGTSSSRLIALVRAFGLHDRIRSVCRRRDVDLVDHPT